ncbi:MAG: hypothetical protein IIC01_12065 [Planctomycetes bacterium]|nr:hypothetical protein [Planctomycetota bacterium]
MLIDSEQLESDDALDKNFREMASAEIARFRRDIIERTGDRQQGENISDQDLLREVMNTVGKVGKLGRILGPQGKMPSPKAGTVSPEVESVVKEFVAGRLEFRNDDGGNIHLPVGKVSFSIEDLKANVTAVLDHFTKIKPVAAKGHYFKRVCLSATRTPSVTIEASA